MNILRHQCFGILLVNTNQLICKFVMEVSSYVKATRSGRFGFINTQLDVLVSSPCKINQILALNILTYIKLPNVPCHAHQASVEVQSMYTYNHTQIKLEIIVEAYLVAFRTLMISLINIQKQIIV